MSDAMPPAASMNRRLITGRHTGLARLVLFLCLLGVIVYVGIAAVNWYNEKQSVLQSELSTVVSTGLTSPGHKSLLPKFTDTQGRLLADPPTSADQLFNPDTLVVAHIAGVDETPGTSWEQWEAALARATGKKVTDEIYDNAADQIKQDAGKVTLLALHAADTPFLVNNYGFEPLAVLGDESGINGNRLDLIVRSDSPISKPTELSGHELVCTVPSSITGYRAAIAYLMREDNLRPNVDYIITWSLGQKKSIQGVADKTYEAAAVSDEKLQSLIADGTIKASDVKIIYQSAVIPRTTIGCFYNLDPKLASKIRDAILSPDFLAGLPPTTVPAITTAITAGATSSPLTTAPAGLKFLPVDYKRDFQFVRDMDDQFDPRFNAQKAAAQAD